MSEYAPVVIIGAGPAGLAAAHELVRHGVRPIVLEKGEQVGGIARTVDYKGYRFDIGGHRFFTKVPEVQRLWEEMLGADLRKVPRLSRIYYRRRLFNYPLNVFNVLSNLGARESALIVLSYLKARLWPCQEQDTFEQWATNRFGHRLYRTFFKTYTEKVWGIPGDQIQADWAAQRIQGLSLTGAVLNAIFRNGNAKSLISEFRYPLLGPGMMWQRFAESVEQGGGQVRLGAQVVRLHREGGRIASVVVKHGGDTYAITADHFLSSMPLTELVSGLEPLPPGDVLEETRTLRYRDFLLVGLIVGRADLFPDNWLYIQGPDVRVGRIQNFKNWSAAMVPDPGKTSLGLEYFCDVGDDLWEMPDAGLIQVATRELVALGLADAREVEAGPVIRQPKAYPVYDHRYRGSLQVVREFLRTLGNLQPIGRNGMHRYNNMDHSMITGMLAARNVLGECHDLWTLNTEPQYHEM